MSTNLRSQIIKNKTQEAKKANNTAKVVLPEPPPPPPEPVLPPLINFVPGDLREGTDYGGIKVEDGKIVVDMNDFNADFGRF